MEVVCIIPARGGSKGVPRKNVLNLAGKPLLAHSIDTALRSEFVTRVVVSTDDVEIGTVAKHCGAEVVDRPPEISGDTASSEAALLHSLEHLRASEGYNPDIVVFLQCTSPLTLPEDIDGTVDALLNEHADSAHAVTPFHYFLWKRTPRGDAVGINHDKRVRLLRQEQPPQFLEAGAIYVMKAREFERAGHRFFGKTAMYVMPLDRCFEIDEPADFTVAEALMLGRQRTERLQVIPTSVEALVLDFDGVFTDNRVIVFQDGREAVTCNRSDGWGLAQLKKMGVRTLVLSAEENPVVRARCAKLEIECLNGIKDKLEALKEWLNEVDIDLSEVVYVGNDVNDVACLQAVGCGVAVRDAHQAAQAAARITLSTVGGAGAIRETTDLIGEKMEMTESWLT